MGGILLAITGGSGAGKTWLAEQLLREFHPLAERVSLDDFYHDLSHLPPAARAQTNFDEPKAIDWHAVQLAMEAMQAGETCAVPIYDFSTHTRRAERRRWEPKPLVIWDGLWLLHEASLRSQFALSVFVDCPADERLLRRLERDCRERGRSEESVLAQFHQQVAPMHELHVAPQRPLADVCLKSPIPASELSGLCERIAQLL